MQDEGEAAVEFLEPARFGQGGLGTFLGQIAGDLSPGDAQQVEILPVERPGEDGPGKQDRAGQPPQMRQRDDDPGIGVGQYRVGHREAFRVFRLVAQRIEFEDAAGRLQICCQPRAAGIVGWQRLRIPAPRGLRHQRVAIRDQQQPGG